MCCYKEFPDEEGIETNHGRLRNHATKSSLVIKSSPMKRGLKPLRLSQYRVDGHCVIKSSPMKRGLKLKFLFALACQGLNVGYKEFPDEEGIETSPIRS